MGQGNVLPKGYQTQLSQGLYLTVRRLQEQEDLNDLLLCSSQTITLQQQIPMVQSRDSSEEPLSTAICSPTPRRGFFTFPERHALGNSPYSTPSGSPFQAAHSSFSGQPHCLKKGDDGYIKRPENAFILFRRDMCHKINAAKAEGTKNREADLSKTISQQWRALTEEERKKWKELAEQKKREHKAEFPHYKYRPQRKGKNEKSGNWVDDDDDPEGDYRPARSERGVARNGKAGRDHREGIAFVAPCAPARPSSAPNETLYPLYQDFYVSNMHLVPSCPNSPTPMPRSLAQFDYLANEGLYGGYEESRFPNFHPDIFDSDTRSAYGSTPASSCPPSPVLGASDNEAASDNANIDSQLLQAELDLNEHLHNSLTFEYGWGEVDDLLTNADFNTLLLLAGQPKDEGSLNDLSIASWLNADVPGVSSDYP